MTPRALVLAAGVAGLFLFPRSAAADLTVYSEALASGWDNWSWSSTINFSSTGRVHAGSNSLSVTYNGGWAGLYLHSNTNLPGYQYSSLNLWVNGGPTSGQHVHIVLYDDALNPASGSYDITLTSSWQFVSIPMSTLGSPNQISGIVFQENTGASKPVYYIDEMVLVSSGATPTPSPTPSPTPTPIPPPTLMVHAAAGHHAISNDIYGINFAPEDLAAEIGLPVCRWGGNATTRYNWQNDTSNRAFDWYFENIPNDNAHPELLPNGSSSDQFVEQNIRTGTKSLITVPLIGWTPKARARANGFSVAKYGPQQDTDFWDSDAGNGYHADGTPITGNDPLDTSVAITPAFVTAWINHFVSRYGTAANGGVQLYNLDNEPMIWSSTHRDVHPLPLGYDELRDRSWAYGAAIKGADPGALVLGPCEWGWSNYFYSALDAAAGGAWWDTRPDRRAHGDVPFVEWYLQQMALYEQQHGIRILDYLDEHIYPQASGVYSTSAGNAATQALRLRSTRQLWDSTYVDESWIADTVMMIPRMKQWVASNYPGTRLAFGEYSWGAIGTLNGAIAEADVLGILGREGMDLATLWDPPASTDPTAYSFRLYRNYDGAGSRFGDVSVSATSTNQEQLAIYAAQRTADGALTLMVVNKATADITGPVTLDGFAPRNTAAVYRYSGANLSAIQHLADIPVTAGGFTTTYPASSATLVVLQAASPGEGWVVR